MKKDVIFFMTSFFYLKLNLLKLSVNLYLVELCLYSASDIELDNFLV
jgi:hypothetical protein